MKSAVTGDLYCSVGGVKVLGGISAVTDGVAGGLDSIPTITAGGG